MVAGIGDKEYKGKVGYPVKAETVAAPELAEKYHAIVVPGGGAPDKIRMHAGAVALVKQRNPGFSVAQLKSAVVNSAADEVNDDDGRARVTAVGGGKLNISSAIRVGATVEPATLSLGLIGAGTLPASVALRLTNTGADAASFNLSVARLMGINTDFIIAFTFALGSALAAAGAFTITDMAKLLRIRGRAMQQAVPVGTGAMAALLGLELDAATTVAAEAAQGEVCQVAKSKRPGGNPAFARDECVQNYLPFLRRRTTTSMRAIS